jgi:hypothetical protein
MKVRRRTRLAAAALALLLPGCFAPPGFPIEAKKAYETRVLNGYALFYDLSVVCEMPILGPLCCGISEHDAAWQVFTVIAMPGALLGSLIGGTLFLPFSVLLFGGKPGDANWSVTWEGEHHESR